jgi:hypothetical protein
MKGCFLLSWLSAGSGKTIKACFGTTKYCNAFLKGVPCNNHDCLYLHDIGKKQQGTLLAGMPAGLGH